MCHERLWVKCINEEVKFYILFYSQTRSSFFSQLTCILF